MNYAHIFVCIRVSHIYDIGVAKYRVGESAEGTTNYELRAVAAEHTAGIEPKQVDSIKKYNKYFA